MKKYLAIVAILALGITFMAACGSKNEETTPADQGTTTDQYNTDNQTTDQTTTTPTDNATDKTGTETPAEGESKDMGTTNTDLGKTIVFETNYGIFEIALYSDAPIASKNLIDKANSGFYNGLTFHRVVKGFVIQGGDPLGNGTGGNTMGLDPRGLHQSKRGTISMASANIEVNQSDAQFFINLVDNFRLDEMGFIAFGEVTKGMEVVDKIAEVPCNPGADGANSSPVSPVLINKVYVK
ncbi:MAG: peptidylprolyl isomerase [Caldisericales bacterium]|nr:peptidylprolyl isomerase [Caldisericales bacterium]